MRGVSNTKRMGRPIVDPTRFPCGHPRTPENSSARKYPDCKACHRARAQRQRDRGPVVVPLKAEPTRRYITTPAIQRAIEESRAEYLRAIGVTPDSTDPAQRAMDFGGEA